MYLGVRCSRAVGGWDGDGEAGALDGDRVEQSGPEARVFSPVRGLYDERRRLHEEEEGEEEGPR